jgi:NTF2 fold immunity protein of polymorphic toxin system component
MKRIKNILIVLIAVSLVSCSNAGKERQNAESKNVVEKKYDGYVPDELTAKKIAEAVWLPIYGSSILDERPYKARAVGNSVWVIEGTLERGKSGGTAYIEIRMNDCKVLNVTHGK